jgi:hypothetical protein
VKEEGSEEEDCGRRTLPTGVYGAMATSFNASFLFLWKIVAYGKRILAL